MTATVSACLIAKNEAAFLEGCLLSLRGKVDEIVVVDTGSTDTTRDIALQHGCVLHEFAWCSDFSAARNYGLERASGDWILYIDADERLSIDGDGRLGAILPDAAAAVRVRFRPRSDTTCYDELRLFLNDQRIRFEGSMHETIVPGVERVTRQDGVIIANLHAVTIEHLGYDGEQDHKHERNLPLLQQAIIEDPDRVYLRYHLGYTLNELGRSEQAAEQLRAGLDLAFRDGMSDRARSEGSMCAQILCTILLMDGQPEAALDVADHGLALSSENVCLVWAKARCLLEQDDAPAALEMLKPFEGLDGTTFFDPKIAYARSLFDEDIPSLLGSACFHMGKYEEAAGCFERALKAAPASIEYRAKLALCRARQSQVLQNS